MREHWRPLTGLLAATCLWAVTVLVLALTGLGGRVAPLADDASGAPPLPTVRLVPASPRLGEAGKYAEVGERPIMNPDRRPVPVGPVAGEGTTNDLDVALTSVLITPRLQLAILTDNQGGASRRVRVGDNVPGTSWQLVGLEPRSATLDGPGGQRTLVLRVYGGVGGIAPTPMQPTAAEGDPIANPAAEPVAVEGPAVAPVQPAAAPQASENLTQEQQIEAIRRRIEARRAQMRAEAERGAGDKR